MKLTKAQRKILLRLSERTMDFYDLAWAVKCTPKVVFNDCAILKTGKLVEWMYPEDEVALSPAGRAALKDTTHAE